MHTHPQTHTHTHTCVYDIEPDYIHAYTHICTHTRCLKIDATRNDNDLLLRQTR